MKYLKLSVMVVGVFAFFAGCKKPILLTAPNPVSPTDTAGFEIADDSLVFTWNSVEEVVNYAVEVSDNAAFSDALVYGNDELYDTTCRLALELFTPDSTYYWRVSAYGNNWSPWSETMEFTYEEQLAPLDLDTTYFPFGMGYEWRYERHDWGADYRGEEPEEWNTYDTFAVNVIDSFWEENTLVFSLQSSQAGWPPPYKFLDLEQQNRVEIWNDSIQVFNLVFPGDTISVINPDTATRWEGLFRLRYSTDTLLLQTGMDFYGSGNYWEDQTTCRIKGIGTIAQHYSGRCSTGDCEHAASDRLLYFYNGQDTIYKAE